MVEIDGERFYSYKDAADECGVTTPAMYARARKQGVQPRTIKGFRNSFMSEHEYAILTGGVFKCDMSILRKCLNSIMITCYNAIGQQYGGDENITCTQEQLRLLQTGKSFEAIISYAQEIQKQLGLAGKVE